MNALDEARSIDELARSDTREAGRLRRRAARRRRELAEFCARYGIELSLVRVPTKSERGQGHGTQERT